MWKLSQHFPHFVYLIYIFGLIPSRIITANSWGSITHDLVSDKQRHAIPDPCCSHPYVFTGFHFSVFHHWSHVCSHLWFHLPWRVSLIVFATSYQIWELILLHLIKTCDYRLKCGNCSDPCTFTVAYLVGLNTLVRHETPGWLAVIN